MFEKTKRAMPNTAWTCLLVVVVFCAVGCGSSNADNMDDMELKEVDRSDLKDVGTSEPLDYARPGMWACRPDMKPNQCHKNLDATRINADGSREVEEHMRAEDPAFDCFYVYPTVLLSGEPQMVDFSKTGIDMVKDPLLTQAARFSRLCDVYAPLYRQIGLSGSMPAEGANRELALQDVRDAFAYYLEHFNEGRPFVLIGHSQGTGMLSAMMQRDIDPDDKADVRERMLSALLIGGSVAVPEGERVGGTFDNIPLCSEPGETGCVIAYASYAADNPPGDNALFGRAEEEGMQAACVDPATLAGNSGSYQASYFRKEVNNETFAPDTPLPDDLSTSFAVYHDIFEGECVSRDGFNYLEVSLATESGDPRVPPWRHSAVENAGFGLHLVDYHIALGDLLEAVELQAESALP